MRLSNYEETVFLRQLVDTIIAFHEALAARIGWA